MDRDLPASDMACPLCFGSGDPVAGTEFLLCAECRGFYRHFRHLPGIEAERARYETHNNDVNDPGYQRFVSPIVAAVQRDFAPSHSGLDFGAGTGPVTSKLLHDRGFTIAQYDPLFHNHPELLEASYDYIVCCEVVEHFHSPDREFALLKRLLRPAGRVYCMTSLYRPEIDFRKWYYIRDPTHVFVYQPATMEWIARRHGFSACILEDRLTIFENPSQEPG